MNASSSPVYCLLIENAEGERGIDRISQTFDQNPLRIMASAMLNYFSQTGHNMYSAPFGDTIEGKARAWRWLAFLNADVHKAFGQLFRTPPWAEDETVKNAMQQAARTQIAGMLKQADDQLANHAWLGGEEISVADIYLYVILRWANGLSVDLSQMKHLDEFQKRVAADPGVREVCAQEGLQP